MTLTIGVPREIYAGEKRVATVPEVVEKLIKLGVSVAVERGAGEAANFSDDTYRAAGAVIVADAAALWAWSDIVFKVRPPSLDEVSMMKQGGALIGFVWPAQNPELMQALAEKQATVLAIDCLPRMLSRAQKMDALTSMASISGYRAVIEAANAFGRYFAGQITAAGKMPPAKVFIAGAGVAGLAAISVAAGLGAIVRANDTRSEVAEQVKSMGGEFVKVDYEEEGSGGGGYARVMSEGFQAAQRDMYARQTREVDIVITTALIPGKPAPKLITADMVQSMRPGSVIVDMAAEQGGNCELTVPNESVVRHGITIIGYTDLPSRLAKQSSTLYATNLLRLTEELVKTQSADPAAGTLAPNFDDDAIRGLTVIKQGEITWPAPTPQVAAPLPKPAAAAPVGKMASGHGSSGEPLAGSSLAILFAIGTGLFWLIGTNAPTSFLSHFTVFILACFVGYMVIWNVTPALHTPLMSVTNAISSIIAIGAIVQVAPPFGTGVGRPAGWIFGLAVFALALTAINMFGGFAVTSRMLAMFRK